MTALFKNGHADAASARRIVGLRTIRPPRAVAQCPHTSARLPTPRSIHSSTVTIRPLVHHNAAMQVCAGGRLLHGQTYGVVNPPRGGSCLKFADDTYRDQPKRQSGRKAVTQSHGSTLQAQFLEHDRRAAEDLEVSVSAQLDALEEYMRK